MPTFLPLRLLYGFLLVLVLPSYSFLIGQTEREQNPDSLKKQISVQEGRDQYPGTGLGLSLCRKIVLQYNGRIWLKSNPGIGTELWFSLACSSPNQIGIVSLNRNQTSVDKTVRSCFRATAVDKEGDFSIVPSREIGRFSVS